MDFDDEFEERVSSMLIELDFVNFIFNLCFYAQLIVLNDPEMQKVDP